MLLPEDVKNLEAINCGYLIRTDTDGISTIQTAPDGTCAALDQGCCSVYEARPAICRAYPLYLDMFVGVCALTECKAVTPDIPLQSYSENLKSLLDIYQYWIDYYKQRHEADEP